MDAYNSTVAEAEQGILSSIISPKPLRIDWTMRLKPTHFSDVRNQIICSNLLQLATAGYVIDKVILRNHLFKNNQFELAGGMEYLNTLSSPLDDSAQLEEYIEIVKLAAVKRILVHTGEKLSDWGRDINRDAESDLELARADLAQVQSSFYDNHVRDAASLTLNELLSLDIRMNNDNGVQGIASGFTELDTITGGFGPGELTIIAARPAMGKTAFLLSLLRNISVEQKKPVAYFSLEMSSENVVQRLISQHTDVSSDKIRKGKLDASEYQRIMSKTDAIKEAPFFIIDEPGISPEKIRLIARNLKASDDIQLIIVDYLQLMGTGKRKYSVSREQEVSEISRNMKNIAQELQIPVIVTSQLSRAVETRGGDKKPILSDLRESGAIEQDADKVLFLYRGEYYGLETDCEGISSKDIAEVIVAKNRFGPVATCRMHFRTRWARFENIEEFEAESETVELDFETKIKNKFKIFDRQKEDDLSTPF